jgi:hypothetical protein
MDDKSDMYNEVRVENSLREYYTLLTYHVYRFLQNYI